MTLDRTKIEAALWALVGAIAAVALAPLAFGKQEERAADVERNAALVESRKCELTLLAFTYRERGICPPCDLARPVASALAKEYPIEFRYREDPKGRALAKKWRVDRYPTFILVERSFDGRERAVERWSGALGLDARIKSAFARVGIRPRPSAPPKREPKFAPSPLPKRAPKPAPKKPLPRKPKRFWSVETLASAALYSPRD